MKFCTVREVITMPYVMQICTTDVTMPISTGQSPHVVLFCTSRWDRQSRKRSVCALSNIRRRGCFGIFLKQLQLLPIILQDQNLMKQTLKHNYGCCSWQGIIGEQDHLGGKLTRHDFYFQSKSRLLLHFKTYTVLYTV